MITVNGTMTLCNRVQLSRTAADVPQLTMTATAPSPAAPDGTAYLLVWVGPKAEAFYKAWMHTLKLGTRVTVIAMDPRAVIDKGDLCVMLRVLDIQITARAQAAQTPSTKTGGTRTTKRWTSEPEDA